MIEYLLAISSIIIFIYTYIKTKGIFLVKLRLMFSGLICSLSTLLSYIMYFYLYNNGYIVYIGIIFIVFVLVMKKHLLDNDKLSDRVTNLFGLFMNNAIIISVSFIAIYISVVKIFPHVFIVYQLLIMIAGEILLYVIRRLWGALQTTSFPVMVSLIVILTIFMYWGQYDYAGTNIPNASTPIHMSLDVEKIISTYQGYPLIDISVSDDYLYYTQQIGGINLGWILKAYNFATQETENIYYVAESSTIVNPMIELIDYHGEVLISSAYGVYRVEGNDVIPIIENNQEEDLIQYVDYFQVIYLVDDQLIYENQDGIFKYVDQHFVEITTIPSVQLEGYIPISYDLDYYYFLDDYPMFLKSFMDKDHNILNEDIAWTFACAANVLSEEVTSYQGYSTFEGVYYYLDQVSNTHIEVLSYYNEIYYHLGIGDISFYQEGDLFWLTVTNEHDRISAYLSSVIYAKVIRDNGIDYLISDGIYRVNHPLLVLSETPFFKIKSFVFLSLVIACLPMNIISLEIIEKKEDDVKI